MGTNDQQLPYNPDCKSDIPIAQPTTYSHNTYARLEDDEQIARNLHNNINNNSNDFMEVPLREQQLVIVQNRPRGDDATLVTGCLVGSVAGIMCCTIL